AMAEEDAVKAIIAGDYERTNWLRLYKFVGDSIPQPDGTNLPEDVRATYWDAVPPRPKNRSALVSGQEAYRLFKNFARVATTKPKDKEKAKGKEKDRDKADELAGQLPEGIDSLVQFQIESVDCRFVDDPAAFWKKATAEKDPDDVDIRGPKNTDGKRGFKAPEGKGW